MNINTDRVISITRLQKELTRKIREISDEGDPLYVFKNNEMEAVIVSAREYEYLMNLNEMIEQYEIDDMIKKRLRNYDRSKNIKWNEIKKT